MMRSWAFRYSFPALFDGRVSYDEDEGRALDGVIAEVCVCVCACVCVRVCVYTHVCTCVHLYVRACMYVCVCALHQPWDAVAATTCVVALIAQETLSGCFGRCDGQLLVPRKHRVIEPQGNKWSPHTPTRPCTCV